MIETSGKVVEINSQWGMLLIATLALIRPRTLNAFLNAAPAPMYAPYSFAVCGVRIARLASIARLNLIRDPESGGAVEKS